MKKSIIILFFLSFLVQHVRGQQSNYQTIPLVGQSDTLQKSKKMCGALKGGIAFMGAGLITFLIGAEIIKSDSKDHGRVGIGAGIYPAMIGILSFGVGAGLAIGGGIHDINRRRHELAVIFIGNQIGLAYNF